MTGAELNEFFDRLFPSGFAGADVLREIAPNGWENSSLLACFHPSPQQTLAERMRMHKGKQELRSRLGERDARMADSPASPEPTMDQVLADWHDHPVKVNDEVTELVGKCLWDVFSNNHEVVAADGRLVDLGSFRGASAFLDEYLGGPKSRCDCGDEYRFYMGTIWISRRAVLTPVYKLVFRRLKAVGADWHYRFPQLYLVDLSPLQREMAKQDGAYSPSEAFAKEQQEDEHRADLQKANEDLKSIENQARHDAMDEAPPEIVRAYQEVYGRDPKGWPPIPGEAHGDD